jgi:hypothetical protein
MLTLVSLKGAWMHLPVLQQLVKAMHGNEATATGE